jgi:hypothetical protein
MHGLIVGSAEAYARPGAPGGIALSAVLHAVRTTDYKSLCGAPVVFMFLDCAFGPGDAGPTCPHCQLLAGAYGPDAA